VDLFRSTGQRVSPAWILCSSLPEGSGAGAAFAVRSSDVLNRGYNSPQVCYRQGREFGSSSSQPRRALIVIVDDEPDTLEIIDWILSRQGFDVVTATSRHEALR
jgi:PleD family two-component response regulator